MHFVYKCLSATLIVAALVGSLSAWGENLAHNGRLPTVEESLKRHGIQLSRSAVIDALQNADPEVRSLAAQKLANDKANSAIPAIALALKSEAIVGTRVNIAYALARMGEQDGLSTLQMTCRDTAIPARYRLLATEYLLRIGDQQCLDAVLGILESDSDYRAQALSVIPQFTDASDKVLAVVVRAIQDRSPAVRIAASQALSGLGKQAGVAPLERAIQTEEEEAVRTQMQAELEKLHQKLARSPR